MTDVHPAHRSPAPAEPSRLLAACARRNAGPPPLWIMRQAGRYLPEYRDLRGRRSFVQMCTTPDLATEVSLMPVRRFALDGAVVFYDILFLAEAMGAPLEFTEEGPRFLRPLRSERDLATLRAPDLRDPDPRRGTGAVCVTLRNLRAALPPETAVIGFAGAPFTVAAYLVEGSFQKGGEGIRRLLHEAPSFVHGLLERLAGATADYVCAQAEAGADVVQLFDTWAGVLGPGAYREFALPYERAVLDALRERGVPSILYVNGCSHLLEDMASSGAAVLSIDWREPLASARRRVGEALGLQGNLDPAALFQPAEGVRRSVAAMLEEMRGDPAYIANLGHGILPQTPLESVEALVEVVRGEGRKECDHAPRDVQERPGRQDSLDGEDGTGKHRR